MGNIILLQRHSDYGHKLIRRCHTFLFCIVLFHLFVFFVLIWDRNHSKNFLYILHFAIMLSTTLFITSEWWHRVSCLSEMSIEMLQIFVSISIFSVLSPNVHPLWYTENFALLLLKTLQIKQFSLWSIFLVHLCVTVVSKVWTVS